MSASSNPAAAMAAMENERLSLLWKSYHESTDEVRSAFAIDCTLKSAND